MNPLYRGENHVLSFRTSAWNRAPRVIPVVPAISYPDPLRGFQISVYGMTKDRGAESGYGSVESTVLDVGKMKKKKKKKRKKSDPSAVVEQEMTELGRSEEHEEKSLLARRNVDDGGAGEPSQVYKTCDEEKALLVASRSMERFRKHKGEKEEEIGGINGHRPLKKLKKVTFSDRNEVFEYTQQEMNSEDGSMNGQETSQQGDIKEKLVWGKRFTEEEDEILKSAISGYIKVRGWDEQQGLEMILNCRKYKEALKCWEEIRHCLPYRPRRTIRFRAHILLEKGTHLGYWSKEEQDELCRLQEEYGHQWRKISSYIGRGRINVREKWRILKRKPSRGYWTQDELQKLSELVHKCLRLRKQLNISKNDNDHRILRDNINWEAIADEIGTHNHGSCCIEWYRTLASSMVVSGEWENADDRCLLQRLLEIGASSEEEVEWDQLLEHRTSDICMKRWKQMVKHLGENRRQSFLDKVDILVQRYAPDLLEETNCESYKKI